jgi:hypothetical protein
MARRRLDQQAREDSFRAVVRDLLREGRYPRHRLIVKAIGRAPDKYQNGLSQAQCRWRRTELEVAGFDAAASVAAGRLIARRAG